MVLLQFPLESCVWFYAPNDRPATSLNAAVFTTDYERALALALADRIDAGAVRINGALSPGLGDIPFGGNKDSDIGRERLDASIHVMMRTKSIVL